MTKLRKVYNTGVKLSIKFDHKIWFFYGKNASLFSSYVAYIGPSKVSIFIDGGFIYRMI